MEIHLRSIIRNFATIIFSTLVIFAQAQSWLPVGTGSSCGQMQLDGSGNVYVLSGSAVYKYNGSAWSSLGDPYLGVGASQVYYKYLTVSSAGTVYVTYHYGTPTMPPTNIRSYTSVNSGSGFTLLGGADMFNNTETHFPCFDAVTMTGAVTDGTTTNRYIKVRTYSGSWLTISSIPISASAATNNNSAMDHDGSGNAYLIFYDGGYQLYKVTGSTVTQLGSTLTGAPVYSGGSKIPFCVSPAGDPYFGVIESGGAGYSLNIYKFNGTTWDLTESDIITDPNTITGVTNLSIDVSSTGIIYAGYKYTTTTGSGAKVVYYTGTGTTWSDVGTVNFDVNSIQLSSANLLYANGCEKYDASGITLGTVYSDEAVGVTVSTNTSGIVIECDNMPTSLAVYDFNGILVKNYTDNIEANTSVALNTSGLYIVKVETSSGMLTQKVVFVRE